MANSVLTRTLSQTSPALWIRSVSPNDDQDLPEGIARSLFVGVAGTVSVVDGSGTTVEIVSAASQYHPVHVARVRATGTTAGGILALY